MTTPASPTRRKRWPCSSKCRWSSDCDQPADVRVSFGVVLIVLALALYDRLRPRPALMQVATASGDHLGRLADRQRHGRQCRDRPCRRVLCQDPAQAALTWQGIETVANGLGNGNGEILGGLWTLLVSLAALRTGGLPKGLNILGLVVGAVGIISLDPRVDRRADWSFRLEPDHLVRLAGDRARLLQQSSICPMHQQCDWNTR